MKKIITLVLALLMLVSFAACGTTTNNTGTGTNNKVYTRDGEYIYFGSYPQSEVTDENLKSELTNMAGVTSTWTSYGYDIEGKVSDFMVYKDVKYEDKQYRGVFFTNYRPSSIGGTSPNDELFNVNGYRTNTIYWFSFEPIKWRILSETNGEAFLCAEQILDSQAFYHSCEKTNGVYPNNYEQSDIRAWLGHTFFDTAFSSAEKDIIMTTNVDNSAFSTDDASNPFACNNTNDKVFLLSFMDVTNTEYGFSHEPESSYTREKRTTAYARVQGVFLKQPYGGFWWLRSPDYDHYRVGTYVRAIGYDGYRTHGNVCDTNIGVVPALHLAL